ncbi:unnamed protein product [Zymoseptoria tritici ST99CH_3D1]|nr:unnamed protein product [Zymoseptoria tritici ST99CH_3D1]
MPSRYIPETLTTLIEANDGDCEASAEYKVLLRACVEISSQLNDHDASLLLEHISITANRHEGDVKNGLDPNEVERLRIKAAQFQTDFWKGIKENENFQDGAELVREEDKDMPPPSPAAERTLSNRNVGAPSSASPPSSQQEKRQEGTSQAESPQADITQGTFTRATSSQATSPPVASSSSSQDIRPSHSHSRRTVRPKHHKRSTSSTKLAS